MRIKYPLDLILEKEFPIAEEKEKLPPKTEDKELDCYSIVGQALAETQRLIELTLQIHQSRPEREQLENVLKRILPVLDSFERVLNLARSHAPSKEVDNWLKSVESIYYKLLQSLQKYGLQQIEALGEPVDLDYHEVVEYRPTEDYPHNTVIGVRQKGYLLKGKVLRDAKVVVGYNDKGEVNKS